QPRPPPRRRRHHHPDRSQELSQPRAGSDDLRLRAPQGPRPPLVPTRPFRTARRRTPPHPPARPLPRPAPLSWLFEPSTTRHGPRRVALALAPLSPHPPRSRTAPRRPLPTRPHPGTVVREGLCTSCTTGTN